MAMMVVGVDDEVIIGDENDGTVRAVAGACRKPSRYVPYKGTFVPYDGTFGAPD